MENLFMTLVNSFLENGPMGLLALSGWLLAGTLLKKDFKKKEKENEQIIAAKDELITSVKENAEIRLKDARENMNEFNTLATSTVQTLDRLTSALEVRNER